MSSATVSSIAQNVVGRLTLMVCIATIFANALAPPHRYSPLGQPPACHSCNDINNGPMPRGGESHYTEAMGFQNEFPQGRFLMDPQTASSSSPHPPSTDSYHPSQYQQEGHAGPATPDMMYNVQQQQQQQQQQAPPQQVPQHQQAQHQQVPMPQQQQPQQVQQQEDCQVCMTPLAGHQHFETFFGEKYCMHHADELDSCDSCQRPVSDTLTKGGTRYPDGRIVCNLCKGHQGGTVDREEEAVEIVQSVARELQSLGFSFGFLEGNADPPMIRLVGKDQTAQGITYVTTHQYNGQAVGQSMEIQILYGLPKMHFASIVAHELGHVYLRQFGNPGLSKQVEEGLCELMSCLWLERQDIHANPYAKYFYKNKIENPNPIYGGGLRTALEAINGNTLEAPKLFGFVLQNGQFPNDPSMPPQQQSQPAYEYSSNDPHHQVRGGYGMPGGDGIGQGYMMEGMELNYNDPLMFDGQNDLQPLRITHKDDGENEKMIQMELNSENNSMYQY